MAELSHLERLEGYFFPLVTDALDSVGLPKALIKVADDRQQGPLTVTLATQIATVAVGCLHATQATISEREDYKRCLLQLHGNAALQKIESELEGQRKALHGLETTIARHYAEIRPKRVRGSAHTQTMDDDFFIWRSPMCEDAINCRKSHSSHLKRYKSLLAKRSKASAGAGRHFKCFSSKMTAWSLPVVDFVRSDPWVKDSAVGILQRTDAHWWSLFRTEFEKRQRDRLKRGPLPVMLRDPAIQTSILRAPKLNPDEVRSAFLRNPRSQSNFRWPTDLQDIGSIDPVNLRQHRQTLRNEDKSARQWIHGKAGAVHPLSFYEASAPWPKNYPKQRALNELRWCLCQEGQESFVPECSTLYPKKLWDQWLREAEKRPPYYQAVKRISAGGKRKAS